MTLATGSTIGIVGGGQLGRMLAMAAARIGFKTIVLDPQENAPAFQCSSEAIIAAYDDLDALQTLARQSDVITYEFENVDVDAINSLAGKTDCYPSTKALSVSQDRLVEKRFFKSLGISTAPFFEIHSDADLNNALEQSHETGILKTRRFGYDGKGQVFIRKDNPSAFEQANELAAKSPCILEGVVNFECEVSVIAARNHNGETAAYDIAENVHKDGILYSSTVPAKTSPEIEESAKAISAKVLEALDYVGVIGIEFFVLKDGSLIANEFAPRVHNSGHWTEAACTISQFEQHIRAIANLSLGNTDRHSACIMQNLIGDEVKMVPEIQRRKNTLLHLYGKHETRPGRKMGHFTTIGPL